jgi:hypothetical protein
MWYLINCLQLRFQQAYWVFFYLIASYLVYKRYKCLVADNEAGYLKYDLIHERIGLGCVLFILVAIISGGYHFTGY